MRVLAVLLTLDECRTSRNRCWTRTRFLEPAGQQLAEEQAALRRVAILVARGVPQDELFGAVNAEIARLVGAEATAMLRFEPDDTVTLVAAWTRRDLDSPVGARRPVGAVLRSAPRREAPGAVRAVGAPALRTVRRGGPALRHPLLGGRPDHRRRARVGRDLRGVGPAGAGPG